MKVFQINTVYNTGSTGRIVSQLKHAIEEENGKCMAAYGRGVTHENHTYKIGSKLDVSTHALLTRITDKTGFYSKRATKKLVNEIIKFNPELIHLHNLHGYYLNIEILFKFLKEYKKPVIWTLHDCWAFTGHCSHFDKISCEKWKIQCRGCEQKIQYPSSLFLDNSSENYIRKKEAFLNVPNLKIVTPSHWLKEMVELSFLNKYNVHCIYNGIDTDMFTYKKSCLREKYHLNNRTVILCVSNIWNEGKGLHRIYELAEYLPKNQYKIVIIGLNHKQRKELPDTILKICRTDNMQELVQWYSTADVYYNASIEETMGLTTVEALACNTPVIVYNRTAIPEVVDRNTGIVLQDIEVSNVADAVKRIEKWDKEKVKHACRMRALEFSLKNMCNSYKSLYKE